MFVFLRSFFLLLLSICSTYEHKPWSASTRLEFPEDLIRNPLERQPKTHREHVRIVMELTGQQGLHFQEPRDLVLRFGAVPEPVHNGFPWRQPSIQVWFQLQH